MQGYTITGNKNNEINESKLINKLLNKNSVLCEEHNVISILLGWDGLGLVSYLLVIYYQNVRSYGAGMLTVLSNRVGDVALMMVIA